MFFIEITTNKAIIKLPVKASKSTTAMGSATDLTLS